jgi:hypothetical protein
MDTHGQKRLPCHPTGWPIDSGRPQGADDLGCWPVAQRTMSLSLSMCVIVRHWLIPALRDLTPMTGSGSGAKGQPKSALHSSNVSFPQPANPPHYQPVVQSEQLESNDAWDPQSNSTHVRNSAVTWPRRMHFGSNHGKNRVSGLIERPLTEAKRRTPLVASLVHKWKRDNNHVPSITNHEMPLRLQDCSIHQE